MTFLGRSYRIFLEPISFNSPLPLLFFSSRDGRELGSPLSRFPPDRWASIPSRSRSGVEPGPFRNDLDSLVVTHFDFLIPRVEEGPFQFFYKFIDAFRRRFFLRPAPRTQASRCGGEINFSENS